MDGSGCKDLGMQLKSFFVSCRYFLGIGALLVLLVYGLWKLGWLRRRGVGFVLNGHCVLTDPSHLHQCLQ